MIYLLINDSDRHLYLIVDTYVKSRENRDHQYWPDQSGPIREKNLYWPTLSCIGRAILAVSQRQFSSHLCKYNNS